MFVLLSIKQTTVKVFLEVLMRFIDYLLDEFLKSEHVTSSEVWIDIYKQINNCSISRAESKFSQELDLFIRNVDLNFIEYIELLANSISDTICLSYNVSSNSFGFVDSFKSELLNNSSIVEKIAFDDSLNSLFIVFNNYISKRCVAYKAYSEEGDKLLLNTCKGSDSSCLNNDDYSKLWSSTMQVSVLDKINLKLVEEEN